MIGMMELEQLQRLLPQVVASVRQVAAQEIMPRFLQVVREHKEDGSTLSEADLASQQFLNHALAAIAPFPVLGEEMTQAEQQEAWDNGADGLWCCDPIDGTTNFLVGLPMFAISVALLYQQQPVLGVIYAPVQDELFCAVKGQGATMNGMPLPLRSGHTDLAHSVGLIDLKRLPRRLAQALAIEQPYYSQRNLGSSVLEWCYLAAGRADLSLHGSQRLWDFAAGSLVLQEAGGAAATLNQPNFADGPIWQRSAVATLHAPLLDDWYGWLQRHLALLAD